MTINVEYCASTMDYDDTEAWAAFKASSAEFEYEGDGILTIVSVGTYYPETLDLANAQALRNMGQLYGARVSDGRHKVTLEYDLEFRDMDEVEELIRFAEGFADYPVIDDPLYAEFEERALREAFDMHVIKLAPGWDDEDIELAWGFLSAERGDDVTEDEVKYALMEAMIESATEQGLID